MSRHHPRSGAPERAAAAFADGHVDPAPVTSLASDPLTQVREAEHVALAEEPAGTVQAVADSGYVRPLSAAPLPAPAPAVEVPPAFALDAFDGDVEPVVQRGVILVVCGAPGFRRAGIMHPSRAEYPLDFFTAEQLDLLWSEPKLQCIKLGAGAIVPRVGAPYGEAERERPAIDPLLAGEAARAAISDPPNPSRPGLRNAVAATTSWRDFA